ncbi:hypothetical protein [Synechococcus elongatus]|uniref:Uncharacterized protein n=1 Tax=Synechococcus elongatus PCC 11802 TaxID=2283154 RepID=A0AAT9JXM6_SYNEL|nr:hypothetical protein [Synechococcus elongatus]QFZ91758.1 hypothetical protein EKO22_04580 [Synechococcus elongatus PCC 11802]
MESTAHEKLTELWKIQQKRIEQWKITLLSAPKKLKESLENSLGVSGLKCEDFLQDKVFDYVQIAGIDNRGKTVWQDPNGNWINDSGVLYFCILITFDHGPSTLPKGTYRFSCKSKIDAEKTMYAFWDREANEVKEDWSSSSEEFAEKIIQSLESYLRIDPMNLSATPRKIGFITEI